MKNRRTGWFSLLILCWMLLFGCQTLQVWQSTAEDKPPAQVAIPVTGNSIDPNPVGPAALTQIEPTVQTQQRAGGETPRQAVTQVPAATKTGPAAAAPTSTVATRSTVQAFAPEDWKNWPVLPQTPAELREVYQRGIAQGNDPHAFSVLGDCQSQPDVFMGVFDRDPTVVRTLTAPLQETIANFSGSFYRYQPTVKDATTEGALLWIQWNDNKEGKCKHGETPIDCELRVHRPSIVFVHVGTHWEARNRQYLEIILKKILDRGAIPILVTKADDREKDERINLDYALLAREFNVPLWNFWSSVHHLPNNGLKNGSDMYLTDQGLDIQRMGAIRALDAVWRALQ